MMERKPPKRAPAPFPTRDPEASILVEGDEACRELGLDPYLYLTDQTGAWSYPAIKAVIQLRANNRTKVN